MTKNNPWVFRRRPAPAARVRLYCFAYAGGSAASFLDWPAAMHPDVEVCAIQMPGRGSRFKEAPITSVPELVAALGQALAPTDALPTVFFGHSLGALVAFELARHWARQGLAAPHGLIVSGSRAPAMRHDPSRKLHLLDDEALIAALGDYNGTPPELLAHTQLMELLLPTIRADFALAERYVYAEAPLDLPIAVFSGRSDEFITEVQVEGWRRETRGPCDVHWFDGDHFFIHPLRDAVIATVERQLGRWNLLQGLQGP